MLEKPLISIIIPTYNRAHIIPETLDSILAQTYTNWECIVVDDGSTDNTKAVIENYIKRDNRFHYYKRPDEKQKGPCSCRNYGFEKSSGQFINFFDSDDLYEPKAIENMLTAFTPDVAAVVSKIERINLTTGNHISYNNIDSKEPVKDYFIGGITYYVCGPMWRRSFLNKQDYLFDERIGNLDDWDFNLRMLYTAPNVNLLDNAYIKYRIHPDSFSKELKKLNITEIKSDIKAREKHLKLLYSKNYSLSFFQDYTIFRIRFFYKTAMRKKQPGTFYLLKKLIVHQITSHRYAEVFKTIVTHVIFKVTGKGDKWLK